MLIETIMHLLEKELCELRRVNQLLEEEIRCRRLVELKLRSFETQMRAVLGTISDIMLVVYTCGDEITNIEILPTKQFDSNLDGANDKITQTIEQFFQESTAKIYLEKILQVLKTQKACSLDYSLCIEGRLLRYNAKINPISKNSILWVGREISESKLRKVEAEKVLKLESLVNSAPVGIFETDAKGNYVFVNPHWLKISGMSFLEAMGEGWIKALHPEDREQVIKEWYKSAETGCEFASEYRFITPQGKVTWLKANAVSMRDKDGNITGYAGTITDINARKIVEKVLKISGVQEKQKVQQLELVLERLQKLANLDGLTQVGNRYCFNNYLNEQWNNIAVQKNPIALILLDIDYFKRYNDTYGHPSGDICLVKVANALKEATKYDNKLIARYGGEEFAIVLPNTSIEKAQQIASLIHQQIQRLNIPHPSSEVSRSVTVSIGIAEALPYFNASPQTLINKADEALYKAKKSGRNRYHIVYD